MFRIDCIPLSKGLKIDSLSYFSAKALAPGTLVSVPARNRKLPALVTSATLLVESKLSLKEASFTMKKLGAVKSEMLYFEETLQTAETIASYYLGTLGTILPFFTPRIVLAEGHHAELFSLIKKNYKERFTLQAEEEDRLLEYRGLIRERFAKGESVFILFPTIESARHFKESLSRGIEKYTYLFESSLTPKQFKQKWSESLSLPHPVLIIGTPLYLTIPRRDIGLFIIEQEASRYYKLPTTPFPDARVFAETLAKNYGAQCILSDLVLRVETRLKEEQGEYIALSSSKMRLSPAIGTILVDMKKESSGEQKEFNIIGPELKTLLTEAYETNGRTLLLTTRKGLSPITLCKDCGTLVRCNHCKSPMVLHGGQGEGHFLCHHCGERRSAAERCVMCDNWNLVPLGVGIERVKEELKQFREEKSLFILTADTVKNAKEAREIVNQFFKAPQGILLTTEYGLAYLERRVEFSAVVSLDSLFALPDFKIQERVYHLLEAVRSSAKFKTIIQTRASSFTLFTHAVRGDTLSFYKEELAEREFFKWPPATTVIKVSIEGKKESVALLMQKVLEKVAPFELEVFPAFVPSSTLWSPRKATREQRFTLHGLLRLPKGGWVEETLKAKLLSLPPEVILEVDPESIL